jgi:putative NADH-flavin reductase
VGCGCRGRELAAELQRAGHAVRGTTRDAANLDTLRAVGVDGVIADPDRLGTLLQALDGVSVLCWLLGSATGDTAADLHGPRLGSILEKVVDTPVRGVVYEGAGTVDVAVLAEGAQLVARARETFHMPSVVVTEPQEPRGAWLAAMARAVDDVLT